MIIRLKTVGARTVPLVLDLVPIVDRWSAAKMPDAWLFSAPGGGPLRESNWKRSVGWSAATALYGHLVDGNLWQAARMVGDTSGTSKPSEEAIED